MRFGISTVILLAILSTTVRGQDWPRFRGPDGDGKSTETSLLNQWPEDGPSLMWTANDLGKGYSSVAIAGDRIYTIGDIGDSQYAFALEKENGEPVWRSKIGPANEADFTGSRSTPTFDDGRIYCLTTKAVLVCLDAGSGDVVWQHNLVEEYDATIMLAKGQWEWQFSESPLVDGDAVVVTPGSSEAMMVAFDKTSGDELWKCQVNDLGDKGCDGAGYSSAVSCSLCGVQQYVQLTGRGVIGVDAKSGKLLWNYNAIANDVANIPTPVIHDDYVFTSTGYQTGAALLQLTKDSGDKFDVEEVYFLPPTEFQNHHGGFVLQDGHIYAGHGHNKGLPICLEMMSGEIVWGPKRNEGKSSACCCFADGHLYYRYQNGLMVLVQATPEGYQEQGSFMIPDVRAESWSHPAISEGRLYLKEQDKLYCYDISSEG